MSKYPSHHLSAARRLAAGALALSGIPALADPAANTQTDVPIVTVIGHNPDDGSAQSGYRVNALQLGTLGSGRWLDTPLSIQAIPEELLRNSGVTTTAEALRLLPTAYVNTGASQITPYYTLRGFPASTWTYNMAVDGLRSFDIYEPLADKASVQVLGGAAGFLYGVTSPAGIINFVTKRPTAQPRRDATLTLRDRQLGGQLDLGGPLDEAQHWAWRLNAEATSGGDTAVEHQVEKRTLASVVLDWHPLPQHLLSVDLSSAERDLTYAQALVMTSAAIGIPAPPDTSKNFGAPYTGAWDSTARGTLAYDGSLFDDHLHLRARVRHTELERRFLLDRLVLQSSALSYKWRLDQNDNFGTHIDQAVLGADLSFALGPTRHTLTLQTGRDDFDKAYDGARSQTFSTVYPSSLYGDPAYPAYSLPAAGTSTAERTSYRTLLLTDRIAVGEAVTVTLGANRASVDDRVNTIAANGTPGASAYASDKTTPLVALSFEPRPDVNLYTSYMESLQQGFVSTASGNAGQLFAPFVGKQLETGVKGRWGGLDLSAAWFRIEQAAQMTVGNIATQDGQEVHRGWEFIVGGRPLPSLLVNGGFTVLDARITDATANVGKTPQGVPEKIGRAYAEWTLPTPAELPAFTLTGGVSCTGSVPWDAANTLYVGSTTLLDAGLRMQAKLAGYPTTWRLNATNLTDRRYWTTRSAILYPGSPRSVSLSVTAAL